MNGCSFIRPGGKSYALTGEQSNKESTARARNSGLKQFNTFLRNKNVDIQFGARNHINDEKYKTPELEKFFCDKKFWQEFGTYIKQDATPQSNNRDDNMYYPGTIYNYFGMAKERIRLIYPDNSIWPGHEWKHGGDQSDGWFSKIRDDVKKYVEDIRLKAGKTNKKVTLPIGRKVTAECASFFLEQNTSVGVEKCIAIVMTFHAIGRAGEAGWVLYDTAYWNTIDNNLYVLWCEPKEDERQKFNNFLSNIMSGPYDISSNQSHLQQLSYHMFASFMRWYPLFIEKYGWNHCTFNKLKAAMVTFDYTWENFSEWSELVRKDFLVNNGKIYCNSVINETDVRSSIYAPQILGTLLQITNQQIVDKKVIEDRLKRIERIVSDIQDTASYHSPKRPLPKDSHRGLSPLSSTNSSSFRATIEGEELITVKEGSVNNEEEITSQSSTHNNIVLENNNMNHVLMNPQKRIRKQYSVSIDSIEQKVVERAFITEYYDCGFHYAIHPIIAKHNSKPSKINTALKDITVRIKKICHARMEDKPSDESHPLFNIPVWPHINERPDTSSAEWEIWSKRREELADTVVKALTKAYVVKTSFKGTISAIYNKLTKSS
mmetsp:Transcript_2365/g.3211  ORF Transcript_2365/g.3211 Transcript_2365/m.3211 type:complete len:603 (-) Transcript_2365:353-2161(-)